MRYGITQTVLVLGILFQIQITVAETIQPIPPEFRARSEAILAKTPKAEGIWEVIKDGRLHHIQSGLTCAPGYDSNWMLTDISVVPTSEPGEDVACKYKIAPAGTMTIHATRHRGEDMNKLMAQTVAVIKSLYRVEATGKPILFGAPNKDVPPPLAEKLAFTGKTGQPMATSIWLHETAGWKVKVRTTYPNTLDSAVGAEALGIAFWLSSAASIQEANQP